MKWKQNTNVKRSFWFSVVVAAASGLILQLMCCAVMAVLLEKGSIEEAMINVAAIAVQALSVALTTIIGFSTCYNNRLMSALSACGIVLVIPLLAGLLFWGIDVASLGIAALACGSVFGTLSWPLSRSHSRVGWSKNKKRYC